MVTGGAGFIGSNFILNWLEQNNEQVVNIDKLKYAGNLENLKSIENNSNHTFVKEDILNRQKITELCKYYNPRYIDDISPILSAKDQVSSLFHDPEVF